MHQHLEVGAGAAEAHLVVAVVADIDLVHLVPEHHLLPVLLGHEGGGVHGASVADDQAVPLTGLGQREEGVLDLDHGPQQVLLRWEIQPMSIHVTYLRAEYAIRKVIMNAD